MIEFELKFMIDKMPSKLSAVQPDKEKFQSDIYYDTPDYKLIQGGNFLRIRDGKALEFKLNLDDTHHLFCDELDFKTEEIPQKIEEINKILTGIRLPKSKAVTSAEDFLAKNNFQVLSPIEKHRRTFNLDYCKICIDEVKNLGTFLEAEIMIDKSNLSEDEAQGIKQELIRHLKEDEILTGKFSAVDVGYVELYLMKHNRPAYDLGLYKM